MKRDGDVDDDSLVFLMKGDIETITLYMMHVNLMRDKHNCIKTCNKNTRNITL